jgi:hypothetical protein
MANKKDKKIIEKALEHYKLCVELNTFIEADAIDDLKFVLGQHWPADIIKERNEDGRPCLVINKIPSFVSQVVNDERENRPTAKIRGVDMTTDKDKAEVIGGMVRHIDSYSNADQAHDTAFEYAVECGYGFFRVTTDYCDPKSFDQEILVKRIDDPLSVRFPFTLCKEADYSDAPFCFIEQLIPRKQFEEQYPEVDVSDWETSTQKTVNWITQDHVRLAEYWVVETEKKTIYSVDDGNGGFQTVEELPEGVEASKEREIDVKTIKWYLLTASDIIDSGEFPAENIPIIPVVGREIIVEGRKHFISLTRNAKDPQRMLDYWKSAETEAIALAPKAPYIAAAGQIEGYESIWAASNRKNIAVLPYNPVDKNGQLLPPPQRTQAPQIATGIVNAIGEANDDLKATTGIFDASLGAQGNETSGRAITARKREGDTSNFHFIDNLGRAIRSATRIKVALIPKIYDTARAQRILGEDMKEKIIMINQEYHDPEKGQNVLYDVTVGRYDVVVDIGPSYATQKMESAENLLDFAKAVPIASQVAPDLLAQNLEFAGADILAERLRKTIPPKFLGDNEKPNQAPGVPEEEVAQIVGDVQKLQQESAMLQQQLQQAFQQMQTMGAENQKLKQGAEQQAMQRQHDAAQSENDRQAQVAQTVIKSQADIEKEKIKAGPSVDELLSLVTKLTSRLDKLETKSNDPASSPHEEKK